MTRREGQRINIFLICLTLFSLYLSSDFKLKYDPTDPDANEEGYVELPNVDLVKEVADAMAASQAYSANVTAFNVPAAPYSADIPSWPRRPPPPGRSQWRS